MDSSFTQHFSVEWLDIDSIIFWQRQDYIATQMTMCFSFIMAHQPITILSIPGPNSDFEKLPPYSPFLNIVKKVISFLEAAIKAAISRPEQQEQMNNKAEARRQGIVVGHFHSKLLLQALHRNIGSLSRLPNADIGTDLCKHTFQDV